MTKIRDRYGLEVFQRFFEKIVELCIEAGLVWEEELFVDGSRIRANASLTQMVPRFYYDAEQHLQILFSQESEHNSNKQVDEPVVSSPPESFVEKYDGTRITSRPKKSYKRRTDYWVSKLHTA